MSNEPTGRTIDGKPWEEPRPPHLPDRLTSITPWVIPFLLLAALQVVAGWLEWGAQGDYRPLGVGVSIFLGLLPGICTTLLGAALFYRHPDAHRRLPMLVFGAVLLTVVALMDVAEAPWRSAFLPDLFPESDMPGGEESVIVLSGIYSAALNVISVFGLLYLARGLGGARRFADVVSARVLGIAVTVVVLAATVVSLASVLMDADWSDVLTPLNLMAVAVSLVSTLAWSYLFVTAVTGWRAGERPRIGWLLVALAAGIEIGLRVLMAGTLLVDISQAGFGVLQIVGLASVANWVLLLLAFVAGLPSMAPAPAGSSPSTTADLPAATPPGFGAG
jgi:hypothetical protein